MLTLMRSMLRSKLGLLVFGLVIIAMAGWGVTDVFSGGLGNNLAGAGQRTLSDTQFDRIVERELRNAEDDRGRAISKEQALERGLIDQIYNREQFNLALRAYGDKLGITATQDVIQKTITQDPAFRDTTGVFDPNQYRQLIDFNGFTPRTFEDTIERDLTINRLRMLPASGLSVPNALARIEASFTGELRSASWFALREDALPEIGEPTEEDLRTLYDSRTDALREPERRQITLLRVSVDDFTGQAEFSEDDLIGFYEAYKPERYTGPDSRTITEFQFQTEAEARDALGRIAGGATASDLTNLLSSNTRTTRQEGIANERFAQQVFSPVSAPNSLHGPVQIGSAWTVIRLESITPGEATPFELVRDEIATELAREQAINLFYDALPRFDDLIGTGASLEEIALGLGAPVLTFAPVDRRGVSVSGAFYSPLAEYPQLLQQAFDRQEGRTTERFGEDEVTWLARVDQIIPERMPEFEEVEDRLAVAWRLQQQSDQLQAVAGEIESRMASGESTLAEEAARYDAVLESNPRPLSRANPQANLPPQLINGLFEIDAEGDVISGPGLPGQMIILQATVIDRPAPETLDILAESASVGMQEQLSGDLFEAFFLEIQSEMELETNPAALDAYKRRIAPVQ